MADASGANPDGAILYALRVWMRLFERLDELNRRNQLEALALAFGATVMLVLTYGFLEIAGLPRVSVRRTWIVMAPLLSLHA